jgi:hypothetical protein
VRAGAQSERGRGVRRALLALGLALSPAAAAPPVERPLPQLGEDARPTPYHPDPEHPWNRLHAALFRQRLRTAAPPCLLEGSCAELAPPRLFKAPTGVWFEEGGDGSTLLLRGAVSTLAEPARLRELEAALDAALALREAARAEAALLLQHDLWERFDAVHAAREGGGDARTLAALARLERRLGHAMRELALPAPKIRAVRSNLQEIAQAHPELADLGRPPAWLEVTAHHRVGSDPESSLPLHAANAGFRSSFRTLLRVGGSDEPALHALFAGGPAEVDLPPGARVTLVESPLAVSQGGELVPIPLVTLVETRRVGPDGPPPDRLARLDFAVLEARRAWLTAAPRRSGGLERLAADTPVPDGASCLKARGLVVPLPGACFRCHAPNGARLPGLSRHGRTRLALAAPDPALQAAATIEAKLREGSFAALRRHFAAR